MHYDIYIAPSTNGHYLNYFAVLNEFESNVKGVFLEAPNGREGLQTILHFIAQQEDKPRFVHLLFGEYYLSLSLFLRARGYKVSSIFFYAQHQFLQNFRMQMYRLAFFVAKLSGVRMISLETPTATNARLFTSTLLDLHDLTDNNAKPDIAKGPFDRKRVVVAGHITRRKLVIEIIHALSEITRADTEAVELRLVGQIDPTYRHEIDAALATAESERFCAVIIDERVSDAHLRCELDNADIVSALYSDHHGSSGMVVNAMARGRPVLFFPIGALEGFARQVPNAPQPRTREGMAESIRAALTEPQRFVLNKSDRAEFIVARSPARFAEAFHAALEQKG